MTEVELSVRSPSCKGLPTWWLKLNLAFECPVARDYQRSNAGKKTRKTWPWRVNARTARRFSVRTLQWRRGEIGCFMVRTPLRGVGTHRGLNNWRILSQALGFERTESWKEEEVCHRPLRSNGYNEHSNARKSYSERSNDHPTFRTLRRILG